MATERYASKSLKTLFFERRFFVTRFCDERSIRQNRNYVFENGFLFPRIHLELPRQTDVVVVDVVVGVAEEDGVEAEVVVAQREVFHAASAVEEVVAGGQGGVV